eukprot:12460269-Heterocapsa_arctica.AAC.1
MFVDIPDLHGEARPPAAAGVGTNALDVSNFVGVLMLNEITGTRSVCLRPQRRDRLDGDNEPPPGLQIAIR